MSNEFIVYCPSFDKVECCFDIVAVFGNNVKRNFVLSTRSKEIERTTFNEKLVRHCCKKRQQCRSNVRLRRKNRSTCSMQQCCFDVVAGVDGALASDSVLLPHTEWCSLFVCLLVMFVNPAKWPKRSRCRLRANSGGPKYHVLYGDQGWTNPFAATRGDKSVILAHG